MRTIVGIDPGTTAAVAVLSLDGELLDYSSAKHRSKADLIEAIVRAGNPLIVATDVTPAPRLVTEIASNTGSLLYAPDEDLDADYKAELTEAFDVDGDAHILDALAAAEYARREYAEKIDSIRRRSAERDAMGRFDDIVELVLVDGYAVTDAIRSTRPASTGSGAEQEPMRERDWERIAERRQTTVERLRDKVDHLEEYVESLKDDRTDDAETPAVTEEELRERNREIRELRQELDRRAARVEQLAEENTTLQRAVEKLRGGWIYVERVDDVAATDRDVVYSPGYSGGPVSETVDALITGSRPSDIPEHVRIVTTEDDSVIAVSGGVVVDPGLLEREETEEFMTWLEDYRNR